METTEKSVETPWRRSYTERRDISNNDTAVIPIISSLVLVVHGTHASYTWNRFKIWSSVVTSFPQRRACRVDFKVRRVTCASN